MKITRRIFNLAAVILMLFLAACSDISQPSTNKKENVNRETVQLVSVADGDTIKIKRENGEVQTVRYLLVDTPESSHPTLGKQTYSEVAKEFNEKMVNKGTIELEFDEGDQQDKYDRLLAYVYVDGVSVQEALVQNGLARVAYIYPPNTRYVDEYQALEDEAKKENINIWSIEGFVTDRGFDQTVVSENMQEKESSILKDIEGVIDYYLNKKEAQAN